MIPENLLPRRNPTGGTSATIDVSGYQPPRLGSTLAAQAKSPTPTVIRYRSGWWRRVSRTLLLTLTLLFFLSLLMPGYVLWREDETLRSSRPLFGSILETDRYGEMFVQTAGPFQGQAVVIVPGAGEWSDVWSDTIEELKEHDYYVISPDLPPFGFSDRPEDSSYSDEEQARRVITVLDELDVPEAVFVGPNIAAGIVVEIARAIPDRVVGLVLINPQLGNLYAEDVPQGRLRTMLLGNGLTRYYYVANWDLNPFLTQHRLRQMMAVDAAATPELAEALVRPHGTVEYAAAYGRWTNDRLAGLHGKRKPNVEDLATLADRTALLVGEEDPTISKTNMFTIAEHLPNSETFLFSELGHYPQFEDPHTFHEVLLDALEWIEGTEATSTVATS